MTHPIDDHLVRANQRYLFERAKRALREGKTPPTIFLLVIRRHPLTSEATTSERCLVPVVAYPDEADELTMTRARAVAIAGDAYASCALAVCAGTPERRETIVGVTEFHDGRIEVEVWNVVRDQGFVDFDLDPVSGPRLEQDSRDGSGVFPMPATLPIEPHVVEKCREVSEDVLRDVGMFLGAARGAGAGVARG